MPGSPHHFAHLLRATRHVARPADFDQVPLPGALTGYFQHGKSQGRPGVHLIVGFEPTDGIDIREVLATRFKFVRQVSKLAGVVRDKSFNFQDEPEQLCWGAAFPGYRWHMAEIHGLEDLLTVLNAGETVLGGSPHHSAMHAASQESLRITAELNGRYHSPPRCGTSSVS